MSAWELVLLVAVCIAFVVAIGVIVYNKIKGKGGCDCCSSGKSEFKCGGDCCHCKMSGMDSADKED